MNDTSTLRIAAAFSFLSPLAIVAGVPFAASPSAASAAQGPSTSATACGSIGSRSSAPPRCASICSPCSVPYLRSPAVFGWYLLLRPTSRSAAQLGVALWLFGMVFIVMQDALQLALVSTLPAAHAAADIETRAAIEAVGGSLGYAIEVLAFTGHMPNGFGFLLLSVLMWRSATLPKWIAALGMVASTLALASAVLGFAFPALVWFGIGVPVGIMLLLVCIAALGAVMLREAGRLAGAPDGRVLAGSA